MDEIVAAAVSPGMSDKEKAIALWFQQISQRFHCWATARILGDPVKVFNVYGHNPCGSDAMMMGGLWGKVGLKTAGVRLVWHAIAQVSYDGGWHVMDGDLDSIFLLRDNETLASDRELARDHDLVKRTHTLRHSSGRQPPPGRELRGDVRERRARSRAIAGSARGHDHEHDASPRRGAGLALGTPEPAQAHVAAISQPTIRTSICNGLWEYRPDFTQDYVEERRGQRSRTSPAARRDSARRRARRARSFGRCTVPIRFVGGKLEAEGSGAKFAVSAGRQEMGRRGREPRQVLSARRPRRATSTNSAANSPAGPNSSDWRVINDLQMALLALPEMTVGENAFTYTDKSSGERKVRITHEWVERSTSKPPEAPPAAVYPPDGGEAEGTDVVFHWNAPKDPDGDKIARLSLRACQSGRI